MNQYAFLCQEFCFDVVHGWDTVYHNVIEAENLEDAKLKYAQNVCGYETLEELFEQEGSDYFEAKIRIEEA